MSDNFNKADSNFQKSGSSKLHMHSNFPFDSAEGKKFVKNTQPSNVFSGDKTFEATTEFWMKEFPDFFKQLSQYIDACSKTGYSRARFLTEHLVFSSAKQNAEGNLLQGQLNNFHDFFRRYMRRNDFSINYGGKTLVWGLTYDDNRHLISNIPINFQVASRSLPDDKTFYHLGISYGVMRVNVELKTEKQLSRKQFATNIPDNVPFFRLTTNLEPIRELANVTVTWGNVVE